MVASTNGQTLRLVELFRSVLILGPCFGVSSWIAQLHCAPLVPRLVKLFRSGPCVVSDCPAALRAGRNLVLAQSSFVVGPSRPRHVSRLKVWSESSFGAKVFLFVGHSRPRHISHPLAEVSEEIIHFAQS